MEIGLHVTLYSLLKNYSRKDECIRIYLFYENLSENDLSLLRATMNAAHAKYEFIPKPMKTGAFKQFPALHGSYMTYGRLILADLLGDEDQFLYLDSDLLVGRDINELLQINLKNYPLGAVVDGGRIDSALDKRFFFSRGFDAAEPYFNAGLLLFNAELWRHENLTKKCIALCNDCHMELVSHDQTVLNYFFLRKVVHLDGAFNVSCYPTTGLMSEHSAGSQILHFKGSPKPWDAFGNILHVNYRHFKKYLDETAWPRGRKFDLRQLFRVINLRRSYLRSLYVRVKMAPQKN